MRSAILGLCLALLAGPLAAQTVDGRTAQRQLFQTRGMDVALGPTLTAEERQIVTFMVEEADRTRQSFRFYGTIAYAPAEGLTAQSVQGAFNFHSVAASDRAALAACNAVRKGGPACVVAANILPNGYQPGRVQLSYDATNAFRSTYRRIRGEKAFAVSQESGAWKMAEGQGAILTALALCNRDARAMRGANDCSVVIAD
jgi:hypothetical protein